MLTLVLVVALIVLGCVALALCLLLWVVFTLFLNGFDLLQVPAPKLSLKKPAVPTDSLDEITPDDADQTLPLDQFEPDFSKPIKMKMQETDTALGHGIEEVEEDEDDE